MGVNISITSCNECPFCFKEVYEKYVGNKKYSNEIIIKLKCTKKDKTIMFVDENQNVPAKIEIPNWCPFKGEGK